MGIWKWSPGKKRGALRLVVWRVQYPSAQQCIALYIKRRIIINIHTRRKIPKGSQREHKMLHLCLYLHSYQRKESETIHHPTPSIDAPASFVFIINQQKKIKLQNSYPIFPFPSLAILCIPDCPPFTKTRPWYVFPPCLKKFREQNMIW